jgi:hypothetical protein
MGSQNTCHNLIYEIMAFLNKLVCLFVNSFQLNLVHYKQITLKKVKQNANKAIIHPHFLIFLGTLNLKRWIPIILKAYPVSTGRHFVIIIHYRTWYPYVIVQLYFF